MYPPLSVFRRSLTQGTRHEGREGASGLSQFPDIWKLKASFLELGRNTAGFYLKKKFFFTCFHSFAIFPNLNYFKII